MSGLTLPAKIYRLADVLTIVVFYGVVLLLGWLGVTFAEIRHHYGVSHENFSPSRFSAIYLYILGLSQIPALMLLILGARGRVISLVLLCLVAAVLAGMLLEPVNLLVIAWPYLFMGWILVRRLKKNSETQSPCETPDTIE